MTRQQEEQYEIPANTSVGGFCRKCNSRQTSMIGGVCGDCRQLVMGVGSIVESSSSVLGTIRGEPLTKIDEFNGVITSDTGVVFLNGVTYDLVARLEKCDHKRTKRIDNLTDEQSNFCSSCGQRMVRRRRHV